MAGSALSTSATNELPRSTHDRLFEGRISFEQPAEGYRAPIDGLLLADFAGSSTKLAIDLGAGAGMVSLAMLANQRVAGLIAVERDAVMAAFLERNLHANGFADRVTVLVADVDSVARSRRGSADLVVANPPFHTRDTTTAPAHPRADAARRDDNPALTFLRAARNLLGRGGRTCFVWPASDVETLFATAASQGLHPKRARFVHPVVGRDAHRVLVEFKPGRPGGLRIEPMLTL